MKYKNGLVLSGGAARGFAHLGVLKALNDNGIYPDIISGVSAGSIAGAFYADGYTPDEIFNIFSQRRFLKYIELSLPKRGLFKITGLEKIFKKYLRARKFEDLKIPLFITIANLYTGKVEYINDGKLIPAIIASSSVPVVFDPKEINGMLYVDGGILDNLPLKPIQHQCERMIGVNINPLAKTDKINGILSLVERTFLVMNAKDTAKKSRLFDLYIEPIELSAFSYTDITKGKMMFDIGYNETIKALKNQKFQALNSP